MMMTNYLIKEWIEWNQLAIESYKDVASTNIKLMDSMLTSFINPKALAELIKGSISLSKELNQVYTDNVNELLQVQLKYLYLDATSLASKSLSDLYISSITNLGKQQLELMQHSIDTTTDHLKQLKDAKNPRNVVSVQANLFTEFQENVKTSTVETLEIFNSFNEAWETLIYRGLNAITDSDSDNDLH